MEVPCTLVKLMTRYMSSGLQNWHWKWASRPDSYLIERLLGILMESIPFALPAETQVELSENSSESWLIPAAAYHYRHCQLDTSVYHDYTGCGCQVDTSSCCLTGIFLAQEGNFEWGNVEGLQWTLEAFLDPTVSVQVLDIGNEQCDQNRQYLEWTRLWQKRRI